MALAVMEPVEQMLVEMESVEMEPVEQMKALVEV